MAVLVTGAAGYIGSVFGQLLRETGEETVLLDSLERGHRGALPVGVPFYQGDFGDEALLKRICSEHAISACVHFAAYAYVGESVHEPERYFRNNTANALKLFSTLLDQGIRHLVFSSTCATYGDVKVVPIAETQPQWPVNPYGWSKFFVERVLESLDTARGLKFVALRYFNAAGAYKTFGEHHDPETHLIPLVLFTAQGKRENITVFGSDYDTPDGTAIRDYIHVADLGSAHIKALEYLRKGGQSDFFNLGSGSGYSVLELVETARRITGKEIPVVMGDRRAGDPPRLIANASKAKATLGWTPQYDNLDEIIRTAWEWHAAHPNGYDGNTSGV